MAEGLLAMSDRGRERSQPSCVSRPWWVGQPVANSFWARPPDDAHPVMAGEGRPAPVMTNGRQPHG